MSEQTFPSRKCSAMSKRHGRPCRRWAVRGSKVCATHGAFGGRFRGGRAEAEVGLLVNKLVQEYLAREPRSLADVMSDALSTVDAIQQATREAVRRGDFTSEDIERMAEAAKTATAIAVAMHRAGVLERIARIEEAKATLILRALGHALQAVELEGPQRDAIETVFWTEIERTIEGVQLEAVEQR